MAVSGQIKIWRKKNKSNKGIFNLKSRLCFTYTWKDKIKKGTHKKKGFVVSMLLILPNVIRYFKGPRIYKSNVNHKKS